ncbi:hypothetical protein ACTA71_007662 [Dictyostelium dimigraforme]
MQQIINKRLKENLLENNDNHKIIVLPLIIQKQILFFLYEEYKNMKKVKRDRNMIKNNSLINWDWFKISQLLFHGFFPLYYDTIINNSNKNNKFKIINNNLVKQIIIDYFEINNESINFINNLKSLETIYVKCLNSEECSFINSIWILTFLNRLINKDIVVNFKLKLGYDCYEPKQLEVIEKEELLFKTNQFIVIYDMEFETSYKFIYKMIKELNPKSLKIKPILWASDSGESHLQQYHSISKLNQNYESIEIENDFIPLYALYRFLKAPKLQTFKFDLQFHFLSEIYDTIINNDSDNDSDNSDSDNNSDNNSDSDNNNSNNSSYYNSNSNYNSNKDKIELDFDKMDNFKYKDFGDIEERKSFKVHKNIQFYIDNGINEDNQIFCPYSRQESFNCYSIPPYSMSLWNECLKLLSTNSTITNLSISHNCGDYCSLKGFLYNTNFLNDFMNSLANNKTIKALTLYFNFKEKEIQNNIEIINKSIVSMLDQNTTLETISICYKQYWDEKPNEFPYTIKNKKCKIILL